MVNLVLGYKPNSNAKLDTRSSFLLFVIFVKVCF